MSLVIAQAALVAVTAVELAATVWVAIGIGRPLFRSLRKKDKQNQQEQLPNRRRRQGLKAISSLVGLEALGFFVFFFTIPLVCLNFNVLLGASSSRDRLLAAIYDDPPEVGSCTNLANAYCYRGNIDRQGVDKLGGLVLRAKTPATAFWIESGGGSIDEAEALGRFLGSHQYRLTVRYRDSDLADCSSACTALIGSVESDNWDIDDNARFIFHITRNVVPSVGLLRWALTHCDRWWYPTCQEDLADALGLVPLLKSEVHARQADYADRIEEKILGVTLTKPGALRTAIEGCPMKPFSSFLGTILTWSEIKAAAHGSPIPCTPGPW